MKKVLFLVSSYGGAFRFIHKCIANGWLEKHIICKVISDRECAAITYAIKNNIPFSIVRYDKTDRESLLNELENTDFDIAITNIHKVLLPDIVERFRGKLINIHPSLLPAFKGLHAVDNALKSGVKMIGTTLHEVSEELDDGRIIAQTITPIDDNKSNEEIHQEVFEAWCFNLLNFLISPTNETKSDYYSMHNNTLFSPSLCFNPHLIEDVVWKEIKEDI